MLYEVTTDCLDFNHRYRKKGERVVVPDGQPVPKWFKPIGEAKEVKQEDPREEYKTLKALSGGAFDIYLTDNPQTNF
jgi:hypothetical protein